MFQLQLEEASPNQMRMQMNVEKFVCTRQWFSQTYGEGTSQPWIHQPSDQEINKNHMGFDKHKRQVKSNFRISESKKLY